MLQVIACGVLAVELKHLAKRMGIDVKMKFLPGGLHNSPNELRSRLQEAIDKLSDDKETDRIVVGYGICGHGTAGLKARNVPLVIPRVHDCIALFLGSDARYNKEFSRHPGTFYLSAGWVEEKGAPDSKRTMGSKGNSVNADREFLRLSGEYGADNAQFIRDFMSSWKRNYTRAAYIDSGATRRKEDYAGLARKMAANCGWQYEELEGTPNLLRKMLTTIETSEHILVVPPSKATHFDAIARKLAATANEAKETVTPQVPEPPNPIRGGKAHLHSGIGLGIDAGGTYTDVVLFDFENRAPIGKGKDLTTRWDFTLGIDRALGQLDPEHLSRVNLVAVSTTLATNALVEGKGQATGLLVMPPYGWKDDLGFKHEPLALIKGQLDIDGTEREPVDLEQVRFVAREMIAKKGVTGFAVGGYASHANPSHELAVKQAIEQETGLHVTCSHDLSEELNYRVRSETAALNTRMIPCVKKFLARLLPALNDHHVSAPIMVVRSDGSLMNLEAARERPLETMLSGPAASVAGAAWLSRRRDAVVVDVGGTTTDLAILRKGTVDMCENGIRVAGWETHVRALNLSTLGLGGDSNILLDRGLFSIGPRRVTPVSWLGAHYKGCNQALSWLESKMDCFAYSSREAVICFAPADGEGPAGLNHEEKRLLDVLHERPRSLHEVRTIMNHPFPKFPALDRLESLHLVQRCGLTPTDLLHVVGTLSLWDLGSANRLNRIYAGLSRQNTDNLANSLIERFEKNLAAEIFKKCVSGEIDVDRINTEPTALALIEKAFQGRGDAYSIQLSSTYPIVGIGAPAGCFVPGAAKRLEADAIIPEHADVANALGAITGCVALRRKATISINESGQYRLGGVPGAPVFGRIEDATAFGAEYLRKSMIDFALKSGASEPKIEITTDDSAAPASTGETVFIGRTIECCVTGQPALP